MLLENKTAILYGGGGHIGSTVARIFAREGARVFLAGRTLDPLDSIASEIVAAGGQAGTAQVDATDPKRVEAHFASVVDQAGGVDISFNLIALADVQGQELADMSLDDYMRPLALGARTHFITATTAARHMTRARPRRHHGDHGRALAPCFAARRRLRHRLRSHRRDAADARRRGGPQGSGPCAGSGRPAHPRLRSSSPAGMGSAIHRSMKLASKARTRPRVSAFTV